MQSLAIFNWHIFVEAIVSQLFGHIVPQTSMKISKDIRGQEKGQKRPENGVTSAMISWSFFKTLFAILLWMKDIVLVQRTFTYHRSLIINHVSHVCRIANHLSHCDVMFRVTQLINFGLNHTTNFEAISHHAKTLCQPDVWACNFLHDIHMLSYHYHHIVNWM